MKIGDRHRPLRFFVVDELREQIINGTRQPDDRLVEDQIAREFGVSRSPVREALRALEGEGLLRVSPRRGVFVGQVSPQDAEQIFEVREVLEPLAARLAAVKASSEDIRALVELLASSKRAVDDAAPGEVTSLNAQFHTLVGRIADNKYLTEMLTAISGRMEWIRRRNLMDRLPEWMDEHTRIVEAIRAGDADGAAALSAAHVRAARDAYVRSQQGSVSVDSTSER